LAEIKRQVRSLRVSGNRGHESPPHAVGRPTSSRLNARKRFRAAASQLKASGYVLKDSTAGAIVSSILAVVAGERVMASAVANRVLEMLTGATTPKEFYDGLTAREVEILKMLATGMANKQIAYKLKISEKTVRNHVSNMYEKLDIYDRAQAVLYAVRKGLVEI